MTRSHAINERIGKKGQTKAILNWFKKGKSLSSMDAFTKFGCTRLAARVHELRRAGYDITTTEVTTKNRYGQVCTYAVYSLTTE